MAQFSVASIFSNNCVLQRNKNICVFGSGSENQVVEVKISRDGTKLDGNLTKVRGEKWETFLKPLPAQENLTLEIVCGNEKKVFTNIAVGEVWLAGGQSNMEFELQNCTEGPDELKMTEDPNVRFYYTQKNAWMDDKFFEGEKNSSWQTWDSEWKKAWSAVGYFFGKKLAKDLGVTVGIIGCNWGGTSASAWMDENHLIKHEDLKTYLDEQIEATKGKSIEQQCKEYDDYEAYHADWQKKSDALYKENPNIEWAKVQEILGPCQWPGPKSCKNPYRPTGLHTCMIQRVAPYTLKGFIFYQGESDDHKPHSYYTLFREMIDQWRSDWRETLPMIFVQLTENRYRQDKDYKNWCLIREAQTKVYKNVAKTGMAVSADLGQFDDIHPKHKKVLGERLETNALYTAYNLITEDKANGPLFKDAISKDGKMILTFDFAEDGFVLKDDSVALKNLKAVEERQGNKVPEDFTGFEIAGNDKIYYPARFEFGKDIGRMNQIVLSSEKVSEPMFARYAWYNYGPITVFGRNGIPLSPFRTSEMDDINQTVEHAQIQQIMEV